MQRRLSPPPRFVVVEVVLRKSAHVHNAELRVDGRPSVGSGLTPIVKAGPGKSARFPFTRAVELPPGFGSFPPTYHAVVGVHRVPSAISHVSPARADGTRRFRS